jgi:hypothetical protein
VNCTGLEARRDSSELADERTLRSEASKPLVSGLSLRLTRSSSTTSRSRRARDAEWRSSMRCSTGTLPQEPEPPMIDAPTEQVVPHADRVRHHAADGTRGRGCGPKTTFPLTAITCSNRVLAHRLDWRRRQDGPRLVSRTTVPPTLPVVDAWPDRLRNRGPPRAPPA